VAHAQDRCLCPGSAFSILRGDGTLDRVGLERTGGQDRHGRPELLHDAGRAGCLGGGVCPSGGGDGETLHVCGDKKHKDRDMSVRYLAEAMAAYREITSRIVAESAAAKEADHRI